MMEQARVGQASSQSQEDSVSISVEIRKSVFSDEIKSRNEKRKENTLDENNNAKNNRSQLGKWAGCTNKLSGGTFEMSATGSQICPMP